MIPSIERERLIEAFEEFDRTLRDKSDWVGWENNRAQKWAIDYEGKFIRPKIISIATGHPVTGFSGGTESNEYLKQRGFIVVSLHEGINSIQDGLETILEGYILARKSEPFGSRVPIADVFVRLVEVFRSSP